MVPQLSSVRWIRLLSTSQQLSWRPWSQIRPQVNKCTKDGKYKSLTHVEISTNKFRYWIELPISIGTVGGLTNLHPLVNWSLKLLGSPSAKDLMKIIAVSGLAQNFAAIKSLITTGIQKGHMKMHLSNILNLLDADDNEKIQLVKFFDDKVVSHNLVKNKLKEIRNG